MPPMRLPAFSGDLYETVSRQKTGASAGMPALWPTDNDMGEGDLSVDDTSASCRLTLIDVERFPMQVRQPDDAWLQEPVAQKFRLNRPPSLL